MSNDVVANSCFKIAGAPKDATTQLLLGKECKPTFDELESGALVGVKWS